MNTIIQSKPARIAKTFFLACIIALSAQVSLADAPCPVTLIDGSYTQGGISLSFRNIGKLPIQQLELDCAPLGGQSAARTACHVESGLFFPGTQSAMSFLYPGNRLNAVLVSVKRIRLSDGNIWMATRSQFCPTLKIRRKPQ